MPKRMRISPVEDPSNQNRNQAIIEWDDDDVSPNRRTFNIETFANLKRRSLLWDKLKPVNEFLETLDKDESFYLVRMFIQAKRELMNLDDKMSIINAIGAIDTIVAKTFKRLNLSERIYNYVVADPGIVPPEYEASDARPHDTPEMTFVADDCDRVNAIIVITKLMFPIFGEVISSIKFIKNIDNDSKELLAFGTMNTLLSRDFGPIIMKMQNYIAKIVGNTLSADPMLSFRGITETKATFDRLAKTLVKSGVNFDLYKPNGNFIRYLVVTIRRASKNDTTGKKYSIFARTSTDANDGEDGRKKSYQENEAHLLKEPLEVPILVRKAVDRFVVSYTQQNMIDPVMLARVIDYYSITHIQPTPLNEIMAAMFIAGPVGSAYGIRYVTMKSMVQIIALMQIYAMKMGFNELVPIMSLNPTGVLKLQPVGADNAISISEGRGDVGTTNHILHITEETLHLNDFNMFKIDGYVTSLIEYLVNHIHNYNVAPDIEFLGDMGESASNDGVIHYGGNVINELFRFLHVMLVGDVDRRIQC